MHPSAKETMKSTKHPESTSTSQLKHYSSDDSEKIIHEGDPDKALNERAFTSDLLTFTTDVRMAKVEELMDSNGNPGADVEALFWVQAVSTQWRIKGKAFVVGGNPEDEVEKKAREEIRKDMRQCDGAPRKAVQDWNWEKEITAQFANLNPLMRGR